MSNNTPVILLGVVGAIKDIVDRVLENPHKFAVGDHVVSKDKSRYVVSVTEVSSGNYMTFKLTKIKGVPYGEFTVIANQVELKTKVNKSLITVEKLEDMFDKLLYK